MAPPEGDSAAGGLAARVVSAAVLVPIVLSAVYLGRPAFDGLIAIGALVLAWEWNRLCGGRPGWLAAGFVAIALPSVSLLYLRGDPAAGTETVFWLLAVVWAADSGAYAFGRLVGGPRLAPVVSPNKTWAGLVGGIASAGAAGAAAALVLGLDGVLALAGWSAAVGAVSQGGDLTESWVKRHFGVKDSGTIVPGHGGLLDRVDGLLAAAVAVAAVTAGKGSILTWT